MSASNGAKDKLYGNFLAGIRDKQKLGMRAAHMALDMPEDDTVNIDARKSGLAWKELTVIALGILGLAGIGAYAFRPQPQGGTNIQLEQPAAQPQKEFKAPKYGVRIE